MQTRRLGRTDLNVAPLVLGGNVFGWTADKKTTFELLDRFSAAGLNAVDSADVYSAWAPGNKGGESETILGEWIKARGKRSSTVVITKVGSPMGPGKKGLKAKYIEEAAEAMASATIRTFEPDARRVESYRELRQIQAELWPLVSTWNQRLVEFAERAR